MVAFNNTFGRNRFHWWLLFDIVFECLLVWLLFLVDIECSLRMVLVWLLLDKTSTNILWYILLIPFLDATRKSDRKESNKQHVAFFIVVCWILCGLESELNYVIQILICWRFASWNWLRRSPPPDHRNGSEFQEANRQQSHSVRVT